MEHYSDGVLDLNIFCFLVQRDPDLESFASPRPYSRLNFVPKICTFDESFASLNKYTNHSQVFKPIISVDD